ncbi:MAG: DegV family protein [Lachnospiraceae bacterium]|jgi:DegV family protein with EDD domain|nr:DegV family protein [Lachnospiraceae bacterium]
MEQSYVIFSDISADIPAGYAKENDIRFISMRYSLGDEDRVCEEIETEEVLKRFYNGQRNGDLTRTSQISPQVYMDVFTPVLREGKDILYLALSSGLSSTYQSSCLAAGQLKEQFPEREIVCVDSLAATGGMGLLLEAAVQNRKEGMAPAENGKWLEDNRLKVCHWFMVEDLMYLKRGGRVSAATAVVGSALNIRPVLKIEEDGTLKNFAKARGTKRALNSLVDYYEAAGDKKPGERIYILHADSQENAEYLEEKVKQINPQCSVTKMMLSPIIGAHTGPGMCAVVHFGRR